MSERQFSGVAYIAQQNVSLDDERIAGFSQGIQRERAMYNLRVGRDIRLDLAQAHANTMSDMFDEMCDQLVPEGRYQDKKADYTILRTALQIPSDSGQKFIDSYTYMRTTVPLAAEYGPDSSVGFRTLHAIALDKAEVLKAEAIARKRVQVFGWDFSRRVLAGLLQTVEEEDGEENMKLREQAEHLAVHLDRYTQALDAARAKEEYVYDPFNEDISEEAEDEIEVEFELDPASDADADTATIRLFKQLDYQESPYLDMYYPSVVSSILSVGNMILEKRGLISEKDKDKGLINSLVHGVMADVDKASCRGENGAFNDMFFPHSGTGVDKARAFCANCSIQPGCLDYALANRIDHGVWGGSSERERRRILKAENEQEVDKSTEDESDFEEDDFEDDQLNAAG